MSAPGEFNREYEDVAVEPGSLMELAQDTGMIQPHIRIDVETAIKKSVSKNFIVYSSRYSSMNYDH